MRNLPLVSIVTVVFNGESFLRPTIKSVINQDYKNIEYIIIDGGSTDATIECVKDYIQRIDYFVSEKDNGIYDAMNKGINMSKGDFILFMNAGDFFLTDNVLTEFVESIRDQGCWSDIYYGNIELEVKGKRFIKKPGQLGKILYQMPFCHQAVFCSGELMRNNLFSNKFKLACDFLFFREAYLKSSKFTYLDINVCYYDLTGVSILRYHNYLGEVFKIILSSRHQGLKFLSKSLIGVVTTNYKFLTKFYCMYIIKFFVVLQRRIRLLRTLKMKKALLIGFSQIIIKGFMVG